MTTNGLLHDGVSYWARRRPRHPAIVIDDQPPLDYGTLDRWSDGIACRLQSMGVTPGDRVGVAAANCLAWPAVAIAILKAGGIITPFNDRLVGDELAYLAGYSDPRVIVADDTRAALLRQEGVAVPLLAFEELDADRGGGPAGWTPVRIESEAVAMIIFTSGSTARPKGAMMTHGNYLAKYMEMRLLDPRLGPDTRSLMPLGLHSSPGTPWGILFTTTLGGTLYATTKYQAAQTLRTLRDQRINFFLGVPMIYDQIAREPGFPEADLSALTFARVGGATPSPDMLATWRAKGVIVRQLYGMTEVGGGSIIATEDEALARPTSCGRGLAFSRFRIVRDDGTPCAPDEPGHILLQGPGLMAGYWRDPEATAAALRDGWMHTGDIGAVDDEGYFTFLDRSKEMIKSGGFNVSPTEIEAVLMRMPGVEECAVFGVSDDKFTEVPCACVVTHDAVRSDAIHRHCAALLAGFKLPRYVITLDTPLPRLSNQKIDRRALKHHYADAANRPEPVARTKL
ncbi:AMP-binding protein [Sphingomonas sp. RHCKR47]|uniref:class I adenylate-forming enzyme family protein n=1 Tax=Sphingomonas citricola TaxID=2862498 RepID=UPI001CA4CCA2|nr:AMP-binding protein [Sphingomonas citricola]MBW6522661.1 AMP-binding protein [Sphingomonas citricola]